MKSKNSILILLSVLLIISGCAKFSGTVELGSAHVYGFWGGLWHGLIAPFGLFMSLFDKEVFMFAPNNNGGWYALGFLFGSGGWGVLANKSAKKKKD